MRLNKYIAASGVASRRRADRLIIDGKVRVNGRVVDAPGHQVEPRRDRVDVEGQPVRGPEPLVYIALNKPIGYLCTVRDPHGRPTVLDLLPARTSRLYPVGRLDADTDGLLLLTNDGKLAFRLTHPRYGVDKVYEVTLDRPMGMSTLKALKRGVILEDGPTAPASVRFLDDRRKDRLEMTIHEGRKRQIRRVFESLGARVAALRRNRVGPLALGSLGPGEWRELKHKEVIALRELVGLQNG